MGRHEDRHKQVGLIGVGLVGTALSERLLAAGYKVVGYDVAADRLGHLSRLGGTAAASPREVAASARRIVLSLPDSQVAGAVLHEIADLLQPGTIVVDTTTGDPEEMAGFGARLAQCGVHYIDAAIGGSSRQVRAGEAILMCGGEASALAACEDIFQACGFRWFHAGPCGTGASMKLVFNLVLGLQRAVLAEGLTYAAATGIAPATALEVLKAGPAYSRVMDTKGRKMITGDFTAEARLSQHLKDVRLILAAARKAGVRLPLSEVHCRLLEKAEARGYGAADNSAIIKAFQEDE